MAQRWPRLSVGLIEGRSVTSSYHGDIISGSQWCHLHCRTMDKTLIWATVLFLSAIMHRKVIQVNLFSFFFYHICRTTVCSDPEILLPCMMRDILILTGLGGIPHPALFSLKFCDKCPPSPFGLFWICP